MKGRIGDKQRLLHILDSIREIEIYISNTDLETFAGNSMMRFATIKQIEIIGEAANSLTDEIKVKYNQVQWKQIIGLRHILVHEYFGIDTLLIWQIVITDLPQLREYIEQMMPDFE
ncbi:MAG: DUF86 domain-containing protein [Bacteroidetes bacterium]|nr:DUF86 domain-containing protein [Bacteroidota bacterium]